VTGNIKGWSTVVFLYLTGDYRVLGDINYILSF
jgi:hypothetical protein